MSLELSLEIIFVIIDDSLVGDWDEDLFSLLGCEVVNAIIDMIVETN